MPPIFPSLINFNRMSCVRSGSFLRSSGEIYVCRIMNLSSSSAPVLPEPRPVPSYFPLPVDVVFLPYNVISVEVRRRVVKMSSSTQDSPRPSFGGVECLGPSVTLWPTPWRPTRRFWVASTSSMGGVHRDVRFSTPRHHLDEEVSTPVTPTVPEDLPELIVVFPGHG